MKTITQTISLFALMLILSAPALGQDNAQITANAVVQAALKAKGETDIQYGTFNASDHIGVRTPETAGKFSVKGSKGAMVNLSFSFTDLILEGGNGKGDETLAFTGSGAGNWANQDDGPSSSSNPFDLTSVTPGSPGQ